MRVTIYLFHNVIAPRKIHMKRCDDCNRPLFKYTSDEMVIANHGASNFDVYQPGSNYIELKCHSCGSDYSILFQ